VTRIRARYGYSTNLHELQVTPQGTAYVSAYRPVRLPRSRRTVTDYVIQEIDIPTRDVLFEWHPLDHVPPSASYQPMPDARYSWDSFHGNPIEPPDRRGTLIVSARNTSAIYGIDRRTGRLLWHRTAGRVRPAPPVLLVPRGPQPLAGLSHRAPGDRRAPSAVEACECGPAGTGQPRSAGGRCSPETPPTRAVCALDRRGAELGRSTVVDQRAAAN
jgi:hypothetical protein